MALFFVFCFLKISQTSRKHSSLFWRDFLPFIFVLRHVIDTNTTNITHFKEKGTTPVTLESSDGRVAHQSKH